VAEAWTVGRWLRYWLSTRTSIRPSTLRSYAEHVERHLIPHLGRIGLGALTSRHITDMIAELDATDNRYGRPPTPSASKPAATPSEQAFQHEGQASAGAPTHAPHAPHKDQRRIAGQLYTLVTTVRRVGLEPTTRGLREFSR